MVFVWEIQPHKMYLKYVCIILCQDNMASNFDNTFPSTDFEFLFCPFHVFLNFIHIKIPRDSKLTILTFFQETQFYPETVLKLTAPCILPELQLIRKVGRQTHT